MKEINLSSRRAFAAAALAGGPLVLSLNAEEPRSGKILSKRLLSELVGSARTAADHRKLAEHYRASAAEHELEAKEHLALVAKYKADPRPSEVKRPGDPDTAVHCQTLAEHCRRMAQTLNELAALHEGMAKKAK